ncbi:hypothetical protein [Candidatus Accumulibacter sp. ACC003]|uniref:hypothetical protein n=1 Tax=Candidatus Accumulibacter sp. ACC003 TaxID=2823334 RepID=UPI0025B8772D|nr:hypothetical protein [Candidatus Accumulibacter sp. ACC003]
MDDRKSARGVFARNFLDEVLGDDEGASISAWFVKATREVIVGCPESIYLNSFFNFLNEKQFSYCVMNNYQGYPMVINSDIDLVVSKSAFDGLDDLIAEFSRRYDLPVTQRISHSRDGRAYILSPFKISQSFRLQLDFCVDYIAKGYYKLLPAKVVLSTSRPYRNFFIPDPCVEVVFLIMRRVIKNDSSPDKIAEIQGLTNSSIFSWEKVELLFDKTIAEFCRSFLARRLVDLALRSIDDRRFLREYSKEISGRVFCVKYDLSELWRLSKRAIRPVGICVCFLGPDGCGKSTVMRETSKLLDGSFHGSRRFYWRPGFLPPFGRLRVWNPSVEISENPHPHRHGRQNSFKSLVRFTYYFCDFFIGYYFVVFPLLVRKNLICFDRYYYDYFVDMHRYQMNLPKWLPKLLSSLVPKPSLTFVLSASPEVMMSRKNELTMEELVRQHNVYRSLVGKLPNCYLIDSDCSIDEVTTKISEIVLRHKALSVARDI